MRTAIFFALLTILPSVCAAAGGGDDKLLLRTLKAMRYADLNRAALHITCLQAGRERVEIQILCRHLQAIPDAVMEQAALPFLRGYLTTGIAKRAIAFWASEQARTLHDQLLMETKFGTEGHLTAENKALLEQEAKTDYGIALRAFASDRELGRRVGRAMVEFAGKTEAKLSRKAM